MFIQKDILWKFCGSLSQSLVLDSALNFDHQQGSWKQFWVGGGRLTYAAGVNTQLGWFKGCGKFVVKSLFISHSIHINAFEKVYSDSWSLKVSITSRDRWFMLLGNDVTVQVALMFGSHKNSICRHGLLGQNLIYSITDVINKCSISSICYLETTLRWNTDVNNMHTK